MTNSDILQANSVLSISYYVEGIEEENVDYEESISLWNESCTAFNKEFISLIKLISDETENL